MRWIGKLAEAVFAVLLGLTLISVAFLHLAPTFGAASEGESLLRIQASPNYSGERFENLVPTQLNTRSEDEGLDIGTYLWPPADKNPQVPLPAKRLDLTQLTESRFVWLGHSTVLFNTAGQMVLTDPVFHRASPLPVFGKPFKLVHEPSIDDLPPIDVVLISHDHYDHLDHLAVKKLNARTARFFVPLGLAAHLHRWGVAAEKIRELDWYESITVDGVSYTLTPSRHFSGRGISNRMSTLWGSWVIKSAELNVWFSGDSGYFDELSTIGKSYGPFDIAFIENGAYNAGWAEVHVTPEQSVQASLDVNAETFFPIHWGKFDLAPHPWDEPVLRAAAEARKLQVRMLTPVVGRVFSVEDSLTEPWWLTVRAATPTNK